MTRDPIHRAQHERLDHPPAHLGHPPGRLEAFLTESARAAQEGLYNGHNLPTSLRGAAWVSEFALRFATRP